MAVSRAATANLLRRRLALAEEQGLDDRTLALLRAAIAELDGSPTGPACDLFSDCRGVAGYVVAFAGCTETRRLCDDCAAACAAYAKREGIDFRIFQPIA